MADTEQQTASADENARGYVLIKDHLGILVTAFWVWDVTAVNRGENGRTQIAMREQAGLWFSSTASVSEVFGAIRTASVLYYASIARKKPAN
jgi:hypothetical protein